MVYAEKAAAESYGYNNGLAEALNNKAFVYIQRMKYDSAKICLDELYANSDNQIELLIADIQNMRLCQRRALNKEFYDYRVSAKKRLQRIAEEEQQLDEHQFKRMVYARTEMPIINSVYYYYVGQENHSVKALSKLDDYEYLHTDTAQYLNYLYQKGTQSKVVEERTRDEVEKLMQCYFISNYRGYTYWKANALQMLSECFASEKFRNHVDMKAYAAFLNVHDIADEVFGGYLANKALELFTEYGDTYQIAGTYRTLASCYMSVRDYESALFCLDKALQRDTVVNQAPDLVASIREMMSVTYSELNDKQASDYNRNIYLDLQEMTRQDRKFEARAERLDGSLAELNIMIAAVITMIVIMIVLLFVLNRLRRRKYAEESTDALFEPIHRWQEKMEKTVEDRDTKYEETEEKYNMARLNIVRNKRRAIDNRAKVSLAETVTPLIDRMLNEVDRIKKDDNGEKNKERLEYVSQLADTVNEYNSVLTQWIELRRGMIGINIESFRLQDVFDTVAKGSMAFKLKGIDLNVKPTDSVVKADRVLTLFMINTIADNAKKHTSNGGHVDVYAEESNDYVDISVKDTGSGMTEEELAGVFSRDISGGHGFGLSNCKGIIERYRKISRIFSVCKISAESEKGSGSKFTFRLPKGVIKSLLILLLSTLSFSSKAEEISPDSLASWYADSVYFCNVAGYYNDAVIYADSVVKYMNQCYRRVERKGNDTISIYGDMSHEAPEIRWFKKRLPVDYTVVLDVRNELAVAALAMHNHNLYRYNNNAYTGLFKELSADSTLPEYCKTMKEAKNDKTVAIVLLVILLLSVFPAYYFFYYRHIISHRFCIDKVGEINKILSDNISSEEKLKLIKTIAEEHRYELSTRVAKEVSEALQKHIETTGRQLDNMESVEDEYARAEYENDRMYVSNSITDNCLSTLKHETMYYPARIKQMADTCVDDTDTLRQVVEYYRDVYNILMIQSRQQTENMVFENKKIPLDKLTKTDTALCTYGDYDVMEYLFEILRKKSINGKFNIRVSEKKDTYVYIETHVNKINGSTDLFVPCTDNIPYLICRRIIRDHSEATGLRGCGIDACPDEDGNVKVTVKLTRC